MKAILNKLKSIISAGMTDIKQISVIPDADLLPAVVRYPFVGLKDGESEFTECGGESEDEKSYIMIYVYVQILKEEASLMGDGSQKGLLDLTDDLRELLNFTELDGLISYGFCSKTLASEAKEIGKDVFVQRKGVVFEYEVTG